MYVIVAWFFVIVSAIFWVLPLMVGYQSEVVFIFFIVFVCLGFGTALGGTLASLENMSRGRNVDAKILDECVDILNKYGSSSAEAKEFLDKYSNDESLCRLLLTAHALKAFYEKSQPK